MSVLESVQLSPSPVDGQEDLKLRFYGAMYLIRTVEQRFLDLFSQGYLNGTVHTSIGQEANAVAVVGALDRDRDVIFSSHRAHGHFLSYCDDLDGLVGEILGRATGVCGGIGGTQHLHAGNLYTNGIQGGIVPCAVGAALAEKMKGTGAVTVVFLGDGTMGQGAVYESFNVASLWSLPILFVLEDNGYAQSTPKELEHAGELHARAEPFGIEGATADAYDILDLYRIAIEAVNRVRESSRPFFLTVRSYRLAPHSKGDDTRSPEELARLRARDPLARLAAMIADDERERIEAEADERVEAAVAAGLSAEYRSANDYRGRGFR